MWFSGKYGKVIALLVCLTLLFILLAYHMVSYGWESQYRIPGRHQASHGFTNRVSGHETYAAEVVMFDTSDLWFTEHAMDFMQIVDDFKLRVFLIEPIILYLMIDWKHKKLLDVRDLLPDHLMDDIMGSKLYCLSFGVFMNEFGFQHKLHQELTKRSFNISMIDGLDGSQRHFATDVTQMDETVLHLFYTKDDECIQISVFHKRNDFLWVGEIPVHRNESYNFMDIFYGKHESAFDSFGLQSVKVVRNIKLLIPDRVVHFISQYKSSKFIECDYSLAKSMTKIYPKSESMDRKVRESLIALKMFTSKHLTPFFITGGTLLGWYGHCGVIPYTTDVDTGMWSTYASPQLIDTFIRNTNDFKSVHRFGSDKNDLEIVFQTELGLKIHIYFTYKVGSNYTLYVHPVNFMYTYRQHWYPNFTLCSAELVGLKVLVPCSPVDVLRSDFGPEWYKTVQSWLQIPFL